MIKKSLGFAAAAALLVISILFISPSLKAQDTLSFGTAVNSFTASSSGATTAGTAYALPGNPAAIVTWTTGFSSTPSAITILLEGSLDNSTYSTLDTSTATAGEIRTITTSARFIRASITAKTGTFNTTVALVAKAAGVPDMSVATGTLGATHGGTGSATYTKGDLLCASSSTTLVKLAVGANDTVVTADSAQTCGVKWSAPIIHQAKIVLTDAEIQTLSTTGSLIIDSPGANKTIAFQSATLIADARAGAYTNVDAGAYIKIVIGDNFVDTATKTPFGSVINGSASNNVKYFVLVYPAEFGDNVSPQFDGVGSLTTGALWIYSTNAALGAFTGGNAANTLTVSVLYSIYDYSTGLYE